MRRATLFHRAICIIFILAFSVSLIPILPRPAQRALAEPANESIQYNTPMIRYYRSSQDGTNLPCSLYVPNTRNRLSLWVILHSFGGYGGLPDEVLRALADAYGTAILAPWGRNYKSMYIDGQQVGTSEPCIYDDFSSSAEAWSPSPANGGQWAVSNGCYQQSNPSAAWKESDRTASDGHNYTVSVDMKEIKRSQSESSMAVAFRKQPNGDCYWLDLWNCRGLIYLRLWRRISWNWELLAVDPIKIGDDQINENNPLWKNGANVKVNVFEDAIEVHLNNLLHSLDYRKWFHNDNSWGCRINDASISDGSVNLGSYGGVHQFDNFRVQNEFLFGESDVLDCMQRFMEELSVNTNCRIDPARIYLSGYSMGGVGTWNLGLHYPDLFTALHPSNGSTDIQEAYEWIKSHWPDPDEADPALFPGINPADYMEEQDGHIGETIKAMLCDEPQQYATLINSLQHENSARFILENALNTPLRIEHAEYDALLPNTTGAMNIWWEGWLRGQDGDIVGALPRMMRVSSSPYAQVKHIWQQWKDKPLLTKCAQETSGYGINGESPTDPNNIWDNWNYTEHGKYDDLSSQGSKGGAHGNPYVNPVFRDIGDMQRIVSFLDRATSAYSELHLDPPEVAYRTYDREHNRAWWLGVEIAYPDQDRPGLARVVNGTRKSSGQFNGAAVHVKNIKTTTLDVKRMGMKCSSGQTLTFAVDAVTAPEAEPISDTWGKTDLRLVGEWSPGAAYAVTLNGAPTTYNVTGTELTIPGIPTGAASNVTVTVPQGYANMVANPGFESYWSFLVFYLYNWSGGNHYYGGGQGRFEHNGMFYWDRNNPIYAHSGRCAVRIKDALAKDWPYVSSWNSGYIRVEAGRSYTASAFAKTSVLESVNRVVEDGKYSDDYCSNAGVAIVWLDGNRQLLGWNPSAGIYGTADWTPLEVTATAPGNSTYAMVLCYTMNPDGGGSTGSAWFDDVALR
jgi:pimeloyl-ACP methyl ester carboxylesterase